MANLTVNTQSLVMLNQNSNPVTVHKNSVPVAAPAGSPSPKSDELTLLSPLKASKLSDNALSLKASKKSELPPFMLAGMAIGAIAGGLYMFCRTPALDVGGIIEASFFGGVGATLGTAAGGAVGGAIDGIRYLSNKNK